MPYGDLSMTVLMHACVKPLTLRFFDHISLATSPNLPCHFANSQSPLPPRQSPYHLAHSPSHTRQSPLHTRQISLATSPIFLESRSSIDAMRLSIVVEN